MYSPGGTAAENVIIARCGGFPKAAIVAFFPQGQGTMVYVGDRQYNLDIRPATLLQDLGEEHFTEINTTQYGNPHYIKIKAVRDVQITSHSSDEISVWLIGRSQAVKLHQVPLEHVYQALGWI